jgi:hypothetical protein
MPMLTIESLIAVLSFGLSCFGPGAVIFFVFFFQLILLWTWIYWKQNTKKITAPGQQN